MQMLVMFNFQLNIHSTSVATVTMQILITFYFQNNMK